MSTTPIEDLGPERQVAYLTVLASAFRPIVAEWGSCASLAAFDHAVGLLRTVPARDERQQAFDAAESALMSAPDSLCDDSNVPEYYSMRCLGVAYGALSFARAATDEERDPEVMTHRFQEAIGSVDDLARDLSFETRDAAGVDVEMALRAATHRAHNTARDALSDDSGASPGTGLLEPAASELGSAYANVIPLIAKRRGWVLVQ